MNLNTTFCHSAFLAIAAIALNSCNKDQAVVKQLSGDWKITSQTTDGVAAADSTFEGIIYHFDKCKVSKGDCDGNISIPDPTKGSITMNFTYDISDKGETITFHITDPFFGTVTDDVSSIDEHSKSKFVFTSTDSGSSTTTTLEPK